MARPTHLLLAALACAPPLGAADANDYPAVIAHEPPMIGMFPSPVPPNEAQRLGLQTNTGVYVVGTVPGSMAAGMGLRRGDVVLSFNGTPVNSYDEIVAARDRFSAGEHADIEFVRDGTRHLAGGTLGSWPSQDRNADARGPRNSDAHELASGSDDGDAPLADGLARLAELMRARFAEDEAARAAEPATPWRLSWRMESADAARTPAVAEPDPPSAAADASTGEAWRLSWSNAR